MEKKIAEENAAREAMERELKRMKKFLKGCRLLTKRKIHPTLTKLMTLQVDISELFNGRKRLLLIS